MSLLVQKYGGTSLKNPDRIRAVAATIARLDRQPEVGASHACEAIGYRKPMGW